MLYYFSFADGLSKKTAQCWKIIIKSKMIKKKFAWGIPYFMVKMLGLESYFEVKFFLAFLNCVLRNIILWYVYMVVHC